MYSGCPLMAMGPCRLLVVQPSGWVCTGTCTSLLLPGLFLLDSTSLMITGLRMASPRVVEPLGGLPGSLYPVREQVPECLWNPFPGGSVCRFCPQWQAFCFLHSLGKTRPLVFPFLKFPLTVDSQGPCQLGFTPGMGYGLHESSGTPASWHRPSRA